MHDKKILRLQKRLADPIFEGGIVLAGFLNSAPASSRDRILRILRLLQEATRKAELAPKMIPDWEPVEGTGATVRRDSDAPGFDDWFKANQLLGKYKPALRMKYFTAGAAMIRADEQHQASESQAASMLTRLAEQGSDTLSKLRKCLGCEAWFFADRADHVSCSATCRSKKRDRNGFYRKRDSLYSQIRYWTQKAANSTSPSRRREALDRKTEANRKLADLIGAEKGGE